MEDKKTVAVIGIGRVGLPLSLVLAKEGFEVIGVDIDENRLQSLTDGKIPFLEAGADNLLAEVNGRGFSVIHEGVLSYLLPKIQSVILTLGTTIDDSLNPNVFPITHFFDKFRKSIHKGQLFILRSTVSVGTTEYINKFIHEELKLEVGKDIFLACCPERIAEGNAIKELYELPQIIGADDPESQKKSAMIFQHVASELMFTDSKSAELAKLFSNTYRYIDFAIGNEFMLIAESHDRDIYEVLNLVNHNYKRGGLKSPGLTAGACLVKDSFFLIDRSPYLDLVAAAWRINENIPGFLMEKIKKEVPNLSGKKIALLGLSFKRDIDDLRNSLPLKLQDYLKREGALILAHDPYVESVTLEESLENAEIVIVAMNHTDFKKIAIKDIARLTSKDCLICDIWNILGTGKVIFKVTDYLKETTLTNGELKTERAKKIPPRKTLTI